MARSAFANPSFWFLLLDLRQDIGLDSTIRFKVDAMETATRSATLPRRDLPPTDVQLAKILAKETAEMIPFTTSWYVLYSKLLLLLLSS